MCEGNLLRKHRQRGRSRDGKASIPGMLQFQKERGNWKLASALQTAPTNRSSTATLGDIWRVEKRVMMLARARAHFWRFSPQFVGWLRRRKVNNLPSYHFTGGGKVCSWLLCVFEASAASGASVRWRKALRRRALRNSPPPPLTTPFTISRWPMRRTLTEERRWRRSDGNSCALWMLTARLPELCGIISKHCFCVPLCWIFRFILIGIIQQQTKCRWVDSKVLLEKLFSMFWSFFFFSSQFC